MKMTGIGFVLSVGHKGHGHSYDCTAWYRFGHDAEALRRQVDAAVSVFDHQTLEHELELAENMAEEIGRQLPGCIQVDVNRPLERIYASWRQSNDPQ